MRTIGAFILLLLMGCGFLSFFALERGAVMETAIMPPPQMNEQLITVVVIVTATPAPNDLPLVVTATPTPVDDPLLLTATGIVQQATERVIDLTETSDALSTLDEMRRPTDIALRTAYPELPIQLIYATQLAEAQQANPQLTATIEGCRPYNSFEVTLEAPASLLAAKIESEDFSAMAELLVNYNTGDCTIYDNVYTTLWLGITSSTLSPTRLKQIVDDASRELYNIDLTKYEVDRIFLLFQSESALDLSDEYFFGANIDYEDFRANYEDGLTGLNLFLPRGD